MKQRILGNSLKVSAIGYGCMGLSHAYGTALEKNDGIRVIRENFDMGYNFFDTAPLYVGKFADGSAAVNEELVGEALKPIRDKVIISTKFGNSWGKDSKTVQDSRPQKIREELERSLRRLKTNYIDLYYQHVQDPKVEPEIVAEEMKQLVKEGKIRYYGLSNCSFDYIKRANAVYPVTAVQERYSLMARDIEKHFDELENMGIGLTAYSPLANGFLSAVHTKKENFDKKLDFRSFMPQYSEKGLEQGKKLLTFLKKISDEKHATPAQISLAWMLCKKPWIVPLASSRKPFRNKENMDSLNVFLTKDELKTIDDLLNTMIISNFSGQESDDVKKIIKK